MSNGEGPQQEPGMFPSFSAAAWAFARLFAFSLAAAVVLGAWGHLIFELVLWGWNLL